MGKENSDFYKDFKERLSRSKPLTSQDFVQPVYQLQEPLIAPVINQEIPQETPIETPEVKGNGHKEAEALEVTMPDVNVDEHAKEIEATRKEMMEAEKDKNIPGNRYLFNRDPKHKLETAIISLMQLHNFVAAKIQTAVLKPEWDSMNDMVADMYVEGMLEGSIAVDGVARTQFVALTQFKNDERAQAAHGSLFGTGPNG